MTGTGPITAPIDDTEPATIAIRALHHLGATARDVAAALTAAGITGEPDSAYACPIARYLKATDPRLTQVSVCDDEIQLHLADEWTRITVPFPVGVFITAFDARTYPHLIASPQPNPVADPGTTGGTEDRP